jgi:hypothetical protein
MSRVLVLGIALAATSCSSHDDASSSAPAPGPASKPERAQGPVSVLDPDGRSTLAIGKSGDQCVARVGDDTTLTLTRKGDATTIAGAPITIQRTAAGDQYLRDGARVARVWRDPARPGHVDVVDPDGIALTRIDAAGAVATLADKAGGITAHVVFEGGRFVTKDSHDAVLAYVKGGDAELAALLTAPLPPDLRALAACDRLMNDTVSP